MSEWMPIESAPRDGTLVELKCTYGVAPWYCLASWTDQDFCYFSDGKNSGMQPYTRSEKAWIKQGGGGPTDERYLYWRPYSGDAAAYVDPTGGMQNDMAYWRRTVASKYGLPLDTFERPVEKKRVTLKSFFSLLRGDR
jgi:hypothetical protein